MVRTSRLSFDATTARELGLDRLLATGRIGERSVAFWYPAEVGKADPPSPGQYAPAERTLEQVADRSTGRNWEALKELASY